MDSMNHILERKSQEDTDRSPEQRHGLRTGVKIGIAVIVMAIIIIGLIAAVVVLKSGGFHILRWLHRRL
jgi:hypothetical protein